MVQIEQLLTFHKVREGISPMQQVVDHRLRLTCALIDLRVR
jgi:hypothetical protein